MSQNTKYEITYIIRPNIDEEAKTALVERFDSKDWEKRRFAYEMNGFREGIYHIVNATAPTTASAVNEFDRLAKINDDIIRHMIVKIEE